MDKSDIERTYKRIIIQTLLTHQGCFWNISFHIHIQTLIQNTFRSIQGIALQSIPAYRDRA